LREDRAGHCFQKEMGFHKEQPKKSRISDSWRLRTLVPLEDTWLPTAYVLAIAVADVTTRFKLEAAKILISYRREITGAVATGICLGTQGLPAI
jgi:hypothetical protein